MIINHNMPALNTYRQLSNNNVNTQKSLEKLSSGLRINKAGDDAAGLAISEKMRGQIRGLDQAARNAQDGMSMINTAEGSLQETHSILQRMKELATQAANDTNVNSDRTEIQKEINQLTSEINRIGNTTEFNTKKLLDGGASSNATALGSNEAVGTAARGATVTSVKAATGGVGADITKADSAIWIGEAVTGVSFSLKAGGKNEAAIDAYNALAGVDQTADAFKSLIENLTDASGLVKLGDYVNVSVTDNKIISLSTKATNGTNAKLTIASEAGSAAAAAGTLTELGLAATLTSTDVFVGAAGTAAVVTGNAIDGLAALTKDALTGKKFDLTINGTTTTVEYTVADLTADPDTAANLATVTQAAITRTLGAADVTVAANGTTGLKFTMANSEIPTDGTVPSLKVSGDFASTLLGGITDGQNAIGGTFTAKLQIGANNGQSFQVDIKDMRSQALLVSGTISGGSASVTGAKFTASQTVTNGTNNTGVEYALDVSTHESATAAIKVIENAIQSVSAQRSELGAYTNRLEHTVTNLGTSSENLTAAESRIRDVDMAKEMMSFQKNNILSQAAQAMMAQANQAPQGVLQLLR